MCDDGLPTCDDVRRNLGGEMLVVHVEHPEKASEDEQLRSMLDEALVPPPVWRRSRDAAIQLYEALPDAGKKSFCHGIFLSFFEHVTHETCYAVLNQNAELRSALLAFRSDEDTASKKRSKKRASGGADPSGVLKQARISFPELEEVTSSPVNHAYPKHIRDLTVQWVHNLRGKGPASQHQQLKQMWESRRLQWTHDQPCPTPRQLKYWMTPPKSQPKVQVKTYAKAVAKFKQLQQALIARYARPLPISTAQEAFELVIRSLHDNSTGAGALHHTLLPRVTRLCCRDRLIWRLATGNQAICGRLVL